MDQAICLERRFFLLLELARHIDEKYDRPLVRRQLDKLREDANGLAGIGREGLPMKWYAFGRLTESAVDLQSFPLAEAWLAETIREAEAVRATPGVSAETIDIVDTLMMGLPTYVTQKKEAFSRARAAGLE